MPTYEYHCDACGHHFDEFQSIMEPALKKCPKCKKRKLRQIFGTGAAILFKGSGFYETDYRSESYKAAAKADQEKSAPADKGAKKEGAASAGDGAAAATPPKGASKKASRSKASKSDD